MRFRRSWDSKHGHASSYYLQTCVWWRVGTSSQFRNHVVQPQVPEEEGEREGGAPCQICLRVHTTVLLTVWSTFVVFKGWDGFKSRGAGSSSMEIDCLHFPGGGVRGLMFVQVHLHGLSSPRLRRSTDNNNSTIVPGCPEDEECCRSLPWLCSSSRTPTPAPVCHNRPPHQNGLYLSRPSRFRHFKVAGYRAYTFLITSMPWRSHHKL